MRFNLVFRERKSTEKIKDWKNIFSFQIKFGKTEIFNNSIAVQNFCKRRANAFLGEISVTADINNFNSTIVLHAVSDSL